MSVVSYSLLSELHANMNAAPLDVNRDEAQKELPIGGLLQQSIVVPS